MAQWHLNELENAIQYIGWKIISREEGVDHLFWIIKRKSEKHIWFDIFDHMGNSMPVQKAYGCNVEGSDIHLYFYKKGEKWEKELTGFISKLNDLD